MKEDRFSGVAHNLNQKSPSTQQILSDIRQVTHRQWWLWSTGLTISLIIAIGVASFAFPGLLSQQVDSEFYRLNLNLAVRGLVGLVLLFGLYVVHQQHQIHRIEANTVVQIGVLGQFEKQPRRIFQLAARDDLTTFYNRKCGEERLIEEMSRSTRHAKPLTVLRVNMTGVRNIQEKLGSASADYAIKMFAEQLQRKVRCFDVPIHLDRGEFMILLPDCYGSVPGIMNRINQLTLEVGDEQTEVAAGWADHIKGESAQTLLMRAESILHANQQTANNATEIVRIAWSGPDARIAKLPPRERQVLELLAQGKCNKEVASCLGIGLRTVEKYRANLMERLDIHSEANLVIYALRNKITSL